jgi:hypothetical protein
MNNARNNVVDVENDFLETLNTELTNGNR